MANLVWVHWFNTERIHSYLDDASPDQYQTAYAASTTARPWLESNETRLHETQGESSIAIQT